MPTHCVTKFAVDCDKYRKLAAGDKPYEIAGFFCISDPPRVKKPFPDFIGPMMASSVKERFDNPNWIFETKLDGYRPITVIDPRRQSSDLVPQPPATGTEVPRPFGDAVNQLNLRSTILDGEIVALDAEGVPRFQLLQKWQKRPTAPVAYFLFDLLWSDGRDVTCKTVVQRRERLEEIITPVAGIQVGDHVQSRGKGLFKLAKERGFEGIIAKRKW
jgi:bifunctional non-homologous end joining protein LigD